MPLPFAHRAGPSPRVASAPWRGLSLALGCFAFVACTNDEDLGGRDPATGAPRNAAATAAGYCEASPDHRLNWRVDVDYPGQSEPAPAGTCAEATKCLDSAQLDGAVVAKALECLEADSDKTKPKACKESDVANVSATRAAVTDAQNAAKRKREECNGEVGEGESFGNLSDATLTELVRCYDKPCTLAEDCVQAYDQALECIDALF